MYASAICCDDRYIYQVSGSGEIGIYQFDTHTGICIEYGRTNAGFISYAEAELIDGKIYVIGGNSAYTTIVSEFDILTKTWTSYPLLKPRAFGHAIGKVDKKIYIFGGSGQSKSAEVFDTVTKTSEALPEMIMPMEWCGGCGVGSDIYINGGINQFSLIAYNVITKQYRRLASMHNGRTKHGTTQFNNGLITIGGARAGVDVRDCEIYTI